MFSLLLLALTTLLPTTLAHSGRPHRHHYGTLQRMRRQQVDQEEIVRGSGQDCQVRLPQSDIDQWATWMQEGFNACTKSAGDSINGAANGTQLVMCYRLGFVDADRQRFGGELLVMQVGNSNEAIAIDSSSSSIEESSTSASAELSSSSSAISSTSSDAASSSVVDLTALSASAPANLGVDLSSSSSASASISASGGVNAAVVGFNTVVLVSASASASASSSSAEASGVGAAVVSSGSVPFPTARARMMRRQRGSDKEGDKLPQGQFRVQVSWGKGSQAVTSSLLLVSELRDDLSSSTSIDAPALSVKIADQQAQLLGSTHFTRSFPAGTNFDGQDLTVLAPTSIDLIGQAGTMASVQTHLVDLSSLSASMTGFGEVEKGLFTAQSSRSNKLTFDDRCLVTPDEADVGVAALGASSSSAEQSIETLDSSTFAPAAAAVETSSTSSSSVAAVESGNAGVGAAFLSSSAVPFTPAAAAAASTSSATGAAGVGAVAAATSTVSIGRNAVTPSSAAAAAPSSSSSVVDGQAQAASDNAGDQAFQLPGREIQVLPIGLGVFAGVSVLALIIVGIVTYERRKYRAQFRARKMAEQVAHASYGATTNMREARV